MPTPSTGCNGDPALCGLRFDQVTFPGTHNSAAYDLHQDCDNIGGMWGWVCNHASFLIPQKVLDCFWNNQPRHDLAVQLHDGIRAFDLDTCQVGQRAVLCHGSGKTRAIGAELDPVFAQVRDFLLANSREVVVLEFGDYDGDKNLMVGYIIARLQVYFDSMLNVRGHGFLGWPTLGDMVEKGDRVVAFFDRGALSAYRGSRPAWVRATQDYFLPSYWYAGGVGKGKLTEDVTAKLEQHCDGGKSLLQPDNVWQCLDSEYSPDFEEVVRSILQRQKLGLCLQEIAQDVGQNLVRQVAEYCRPRLYRLWRIRDDAYWVTPLFSAVKEMNQYNVGKFH